MMNNTQSYTSRRSELETYFDRTAIEAWEKLTSNVPVSGIRATVRAGRDAMRATLLDWLPQDLSGARILDAGCGAGQLSIAAAKRGAHVVGVDLSPKLLDLARQRYAAEPLDGSMEFHAGDMFDSNLGTFDYVVAMDSLIHYETTDIARVLEGFSNRTNKSILFTIAPKTLLLDVMHNVGKLFPRKDRAPAIQPAAKKHLLRLIAEIPNLYGWAPGRDHRINSSFYISHAMELCKR